MELAPWTAPPNQRSIERSSRLSLEKARPLPSMAPSGRDARDLKYFDSWFDHPERALTPQRMFEAFRLAELGYPQRQVDLFDGLLEGDATARNLFEHRERVVANKPLILTAGDNTDVGMTAQRVLSFAFARLAQKQALAHMLLANRYGYSAVELEWGLVQIEGRQWVVPVDLIMPPMRRFTIGTQGMVPEVRFDELRLLTDLAKPQGDDLRPGKWIVCKRSPTQLARAGLMRTAAVYIMAKRFGFRDLIVLSQRYGIPLPIAHYAETADDLAKEVARQIIANMGTDGGAVVPKDQIELEVVKGVEGSSVVQGIVLSYCNAELSKLVNGSTLRNDNSSSGGASYAMANVHNEVAWDEVQGDGGMVGEAISLQVCVPFCRYNNLACEAPHATMIVEPDLTADGMMTLAVKAKNELGIEVSMAQVRERCGLRPPINTADSAPGMQIDKFPTPAGGPP